MLNFPHSLDSHKKLCSLYFQIANKLKPLLTIADSLSHHCRFSLSPSPNPVSLSPNPASLSQTPSQTQPHRRNHYRKPNLTVANPTSLSPILVSPSPFLALPSPIHLASPSLIHFAHFNSQRFSSPAVRDVSARRPFVTLQSFTNHS